MPAQRTSVAATVTETSASSASCGRLAGHHREPQRGDHRGCRAVRIGRPDRQGGRAAHGRVAGGVVQRRAVDAVRRRALVVGGHQRGPQRSGARRPRIGDRRGGEPAPVPGLVLVEDREVDVARAGGDRAALRRRPPRRPGSRPRRSRRRGAGSGSTSAATLYSCAVPQSQSSPGAVQVSCDLGAVRVGCQAGAAFRAAGCRCRRRRCSTRRGVRSTTRRWCRRRAGRCPT